MLSRLYLALGIVTASMSIVDVCVHPENDHTGLLIVCLVLLLGAIALGGSNPPRRRVRC